MELYKRNESGAVGDRFIDPVIANRPILMLTGDGSGRRVKSTAVKYIGKWRG